MQEMLTNQILLFHFEQEMLTNQILLFHFETVATPWLQYYQYWCSSRAAD